MNFSCFHPSQFRGDHRVVCWARKFGLLLFILAMICIPSAAGAQPCDPFDDCPIVVDANGFPVHLAIEEGMTVATFTDCLDICGYVVGVYDTSNPVVDAPGTDVNWAPTRYSGPGDPTDPLDPFYAHSWTVGNLGQVFGVTLDDGPSPSIYVSATPINTFGCPQGVFSSLGSGGVYKLDGNDGTICEVISLPNPSEASLGQLDHYTVTGLEGFQFEVLYISNFDDGKIYAVFPGCPGSIYSTFDHGVDGRPQETDDIGNPLVPIEDNVNEMFTQLGRRIWGLRINEPESRLYYAVWNVVATGVDPVEDNEIWSVAIDPVTGDFVPNSATREFKIPALGGNEWPVADIAFECGNRMVVTQRGVNVVLEDVSPHSAFTLEYTGSHLSWTASDADKFHAGNFSTGRNGCGGVDFDPYGNVVATSNALHVNNPDYIYGFAIIPSTGSNPAPPYMQDSYLIDVDCSPNTTLDKKQIFDVECYRPHSYNCASVCANIESETIHCIPIEQGSYQYSVDIINKSEFDVVKVLIPDVTDVNGDILVDVEPNVVDYSPTTYGTGEALPTLELTLNPVPGSGYEAGDFIPLAIGLMAKDDDGTIFQCCAIDREVELPVCCNELKNYSFGEFDSGCVELTLEFTNLDQMAPVEAFHAFLLGLSPASMTFDPDYFALPGGVLDNSPGTLTTTICGVSPGDTIEFELIIHSENLEECCNQLHTLVIPEGGPEPCISELQCETIMVDGVLQLLLTWPPPANDECCIDEEGNWRQAVIIRDGEFGIISVPVTDLMAIVPCLPGEYCLWCGIASEGVLQACCTVDPQFLRGDANADGFFDISDVIGSLGFLFQNETVPCLVALDCNDDEVVDIGDAIYSLDALFGDGPTPWPPFQLCGIDETEGTLGCDTFPACDEANSDPQGG